MFAKKSPFDRALFYCSSSAFILKITTFFYKICDILVKTEYYIMYYKFFGGILMKKCECNLLARAFIPWQKWPEEIYDFERGLMIGTIFPCLNQPMCEYEWGETR